MKPSWLRLMCAWLLLCAGASAETMLQYFNTSWAEITRKMPELAEAGYQSLWLPPPTKGSGGLSVGYDTWDRFDLGSKDQRGSVSTRYGTEADLIELVRVAHRFGIRVYFDNIMNHNAFDVPGYDAYTSIETYPGFLPEDFHLYRTDDGFYEKWDNTRDWNDSWQVQNLGLSDLIDIATEPGGTNYNHGSYEGDTIPKIKTIRHPENPEYYCYDVDGNYVGFGTDNGLTPEIIQANPAVYAEYVEDMLNRAARWQIDRLKADGFRLDAVKHTPADFFGATYGADKDSSDYGYLGQAQRQFNLTRGFSDANHRDTVFDTEAPRDDAMMFGEHLGQPPAYSSYIDAGMRLVDNDLRSNLNNILGNPWSGLDGYQYAGSGGFSDSIAVMHAQSHDNDYASAKELQHAMYFTRSGLGLIYTDGNYHAETLGESGGAFPRHANTAFLGQWGDERIPNLLKIHRDFARGWQKGQEGGADLISYERVDKREDANLSDADGVTMLIAINDNYASGVGMSGWTSFPSTPGAGSDNNPNTGDEYLYQYARGGDSMVGFYKYASDLGSVIVPSGGYFVFAPRTPEASDLWAGVGGDEITIHENGVPAGSITVTRQDGTDGDPAFNPYGVPDAVTDDYSYDMDIPRVTDVGDLSFIVRTDGSAENILLKLDGGIDLNGTRPTGNTDPFFRDHPPAVSTDVFLGYEQPTFVTRMGGEKFAAVDTTRNQIGSVGAETYVKEIGAGDFTVNTGPEGANDYSTDDGDMASFLYHDPDATVGGEPGGGWSSGSAPLQYVEEGSTISLWAKPNGVGLGFRMFCYYTTDGSNPEGAGGVGMGSTEVVEMGYSHDESGNDWWMTATLAQPPAGTELRYKIGIFKEGVSSIYPSSQTSVDRKKRMMTVFEVDGIDGTTLTHAPHVDYGESETGLREGYHVLRARAFLRRNGRTSMYRTITQTFYYDAARPEGQIVYPGGDGETIGGSEYGVVVRADLSTDEVWYRISDGDATNDDAVTGVDNGNGAWVSASEVTVNQDVVPADPDYVREFRFNYVNIPSSGSATVEVRLKELSSSADDALSDAEGHFTTLTRTLQTAGPDYRAFVAWPPVDGYSVNDEYTFKVHFSKALADGLSMEDLKSRFVVRYGGDDAFAGRALALAADALWIEYDVTGDYHALAFKLPNLYDGRPDTLYRVEVTHDRPDPAADLLATRRVKFEASTKPRVEIIRPLEIDSNGQAVEIVLPDGPGADTLDYTVQVETEATATAVDLVFTLGSGVLTAADADSVSPGIQPEIVGSSAYWDFTWTITSAGSYRLMATATNATGTNTTSRNATVVFRQVVTADSNDLDDDDDGLADVDEGTVTPLPSGYASTDPRYKSNSEQWTNSEVHVHNAYGNSDPLMPDTDADGLPDGLEVGWRTPGTDTDELADTNGDGLPNFIGDLDPPFYNTLDNYGSVPGVNSASEGGDRAEQLRGTVTDAGNPDSDGDGLLDGVEDANANGWVDGDGEPLGTGDAATLTRNWPDGVMGAGETWLETDPLNTDTDGDGLSDGYGEDKDLNGVITGDLNGDRIWQSGEIWSETDALKADTDGDGLPDGWESRFGLNALDDGTTAMDGGAASPDNGAAGDPDDDGLNNLQELAAGTDPRVDNTVVLVPGEEIVIGPVAEEDAIVFGAVSNRQEFTDWKIDDLVVLDAFEGDGTGYQSGDTYLAWDGHDTSRDLVAFYARDGGDPSVGGTGDFYFRADFHDLKPYAEEGSLDLYVVIDTGNPEVGEYALPDEVDGATEMRWEAVVAVYQSNNGAVYVDTNAATHTTSINEDLTAKGVERRDQTSASGFLKAYYDSDLDAVEFSISRQALLDAGWLGDPSSLNFQVFTTRDGTQNSPQGDGDIGGRNDFRDTIYDDWLSEDYWRDQSYIGENSVLQNWFNYNGPDKGRRAKVMLFTHGNSPVLTGHEMQERINDGAGGGYYRMLDAHQAYAAKGGLHVTPMLASAIEWAAVDPAAGVPEKDGPSFNSRVGGLMADGVLEMVASTFADAPMSYYDQDLLADSVARADAMLAGIYGNAPSSSVLWIPERIIDDGVLTKVSGLGFSHVFMDQFRHIQDRFGRSSALLDDGYRVNRINGLNTFVINDQASAFRFQTTDNGLDINLRKLASRKARSGEQHQMLILYSDLSDFRTKANADAYDADVAWLASRPWIELVGPDQVANGEVDLSIPPDGFGDQFASLERGTTSFGRKLGPLWVDHAAEGDYDNWWFGSSQEESLRDKVFDVRPGTPVAPLGDAFFGVQDFAGTGSGMAAGVWSALAGLPEADGGGLGRSVYHAANFLAGWHDEDNTDLRVYSTGDFIYPDTSYDELAGFAKQAQAQLRHAAVYQEVAAWAAAPPAGAEAVAADVDLDGEDEYLLKNERVFALFETIGGRCTAAWARDSGGGGVSQIVGNFLSASGSETEHEGETNRDGDGEILARRTSAFKDLWAIDGSGTSEHVNALYTVTAAATGTGWTFETAGGEIAKTITLAAASDTMVADYSLGGGLTKLYVRFGLSPDLESLLVTGQSGLVVETAADSVTVSQTGPTSVSSAAVLLAADVAWNPNATDDDLDAYAAVNMRNQAQTHQVEVESLATSFTVSLSLATAVGDRDNDGLPGDWEADNGLNDDDPYGDNGAAGDPDGDGISNFVEWLVGLDPQVKDASDFPKLSVDASAGGVSLSFPTMPDRIYQLQVSNDVRVWDDYGAEHVTGPDDPPGTLEVEDSDGLPKRFYRMVILAPR